MMGLIGPLLDDIAPLWRDPVGVWKRYFFSPGTGLNASICRIVIVGGQMFWFPIGVQRHLDYIKNNDGFIHPEPLIQLLSFIFGEDSIRSESLFLTCAMLLLITGWMAFVGLFTRPALFVFTAINMLYVTHGYSYGEHHHREAMYLMAMMLLVFSPCNRYLSVDYLIAKFTGMSRSIDFVTDMKATATVYGTWAVRLAMTLLSIAYFTAGVCKLANGGIDWLNGYTMQRFIFQDAVRYDLPWGLWVSHQWWLCFLMGIGAVVFEVGFPAVLWKRWLAFIILPMGVTMHTLILYLQAAPFYHFMVLYVLFINFEYFFQRGLISHGGTQTQRNEMSGQDAKARSA